MKISFVIPAYNEEKYIGLAIEAILKQPEYLVKEIIVADDNSTDRTAEIARQYPKVKVVLEKNKGTNWARQAGFRVASGEIVAFIDADNWVAPNWSETVLKYLARRNMSAVSGPYSYRDQSSFYNFLAVYGFYLFVWPLYFLIHYVLRRGSIVLGGNLAVKREALVKVGGLDTRYTFYGDDANTGKRLRQTGKVIFTPRLLVSATARRFQKHGYFPTLARYFINFLWVIFFNKPFSK